MSDPNEWDGIYVHFSAEAGHSTAFKMACGIVLSTWPGKWGRGQGTTEGKLGYTFHARFTTCPHCMDTEYWKTSNEREASYIEESTAVGQHAFTNCPGALQEAEGLNRNARAD